MKKLTISQGVYIYTFVDEFVGMSLIVLAPLYFLSLGLSLSSIGFFLALSPIAFAVLRLFLAEIADSRGAYGIVKLGVALRTASTLFFLFPMNFLVASIANASAGMGGSPIWTVNRKLLYENDKEERSGKKAAILKNVKEAGDGLAKFICLFVVQLFGFFYTFLSLFIFSFLLVIPAKMLSKADARKANVRAANLSLREIFSTVDLRRYSRTFSNIALASLIGLAVDGTVYSFTVAIFLKEIIKLSYFETGFYLALLSLVSFSSSAFFIHFAKKHVSRTSAFIFGSFLVSALAILYFFRSPAGALAFVLLIGTADGVRNIYNEELVAFAVNSDRFARRNPAKAIAVMGFWAQASKSVSIFAAGIIADFFGFGPVFLIVSALHIFYVLFAYRTLAPVQKAQ
ncbi:MAG: MFS transporter [archaeon]